MDAESQGAKYRGRTSCEIVEKESDRGNQPRSPFPSEKHPGKVYSWWWLEVLLCCVVEGTGEERNVEGERLGERSYMNVG